MSDVGGDPMNPWFAKAIILASTMVMLVIRAPHGQRSREVKVVRSGRGHWRSPS